MIQLKEKYTIALVTHNMQQALRVADRPPSSEWIFPRAAAPAIGGDGTHQEDFRGTRATIDPAIRPGRVQLRSKGDIMGCDF